VSAKLHRMLRLVFAFLFLTLTVHVQLNAASESSAPFEPEATEDTNNPDTNTSEGDDNEWDDTDWEDQESFWLDDLDHSTGVADHDEDNDGASIQDVYNNPDTFSTSAYDPDEIDSNMAAFVAVVEGESGEMEFIVVTNFDNWDIMQDAIQSGNDQAIDILTDGTLVHENTHIDDALNSNPDILDNASDGDVLRNDLEDTALVESRACQNEVDFYNDILEKGEYNGEELSSDTIRLVEQARDEAQTMLDYYLDQLDD